MPDSPILLGIRHHGPGSARAVRRALQAYLPEVVLIEGPPEADPLVALAASPQLHPPVALLAYSAAADGPRPVFWPFGEFSPEWQAIRWAVEHEVPVRFCDLPATNRSTVEPQEKTERLDPIGELAQAAGYDDPERWWEDVVEHQRPGGEAPDELAAALAPFEAIAGAMAAVRDSTVDSDDEARREAAMRTVLRSVIKQHERVAVVCGAWHMPALTPPWPTATADATVLRGLPRHKVSLTWVPWTHGRLASWTGYGAGVTSPGWYHHLFAQPDRPIVRWFVAVAGLLREEGQPVSSAHVIEAVRLAEALSVLRGRPLPGLAEVTEATRAILCDGEELRLALVHRRMVVGEQLGTVPDETPSVPLVADVTATQRRLKLKPSPLVAELSLDLRRDIDLNRSRFLHRLRLLNVEWGQPAAERRGTGTFWEDWRTQWQPQFAIDLIEAGAYGTTVESAATGKATELAAAADSLAAVTALVQRCLLADLPAAWPVVLRALSDRAALDADVTHLMAAVPALARTLRYGDVRGTDVDAVRGVTRGLVLRVCIGLPTAVSTLDDAAAAAMREHLDAVHAALGLLDDETLVAERARGAERSEAPQLARGSWQTERARGAERSEAPQLARGSWQTEWQDTLLRLADRADLHGLIGGRLTRLLLDGGQLPADEVRRRMGLVLTVGVPPAHAAAWIEGFLAGGGLLLAHDPALLALVDAWLAGIPGETFVEVLPLLRRTFGAFARPERRTIGERARRLGSGQSIVDDEGLDRERAALVLPTLRLLLGRDDLEVGGEQS
jgi:hypothetical protein